MIRSMLKGAVSRVARRVQRGLGKSESNEVQSFDAALSEAVAETAPNTGEQVLGLPPLRPEVRKEAWSIFLAGVKTWVDGFEVEGAPQPDRLSLMRSWGEGRYTVALLVMAHEVLGLQRLVRRALIELDHDRKADLEYIERVSANMIQVSHMGFPDLMSTYDYSTAWRRD